MGRAISLLSPEQLRKWFLHHCTLSEGCWEWKKVFNGKGYGRIKLKKKNISAHRFSYSLFVGEIPDGLRVLHHCDNRRCVRPEHLFLGTEKDNQVDAARKDRKSTKLNRSDVLAIRILLKYGTRQVRIAERFGIHQSLVSRIKTQQRRKYVS